MIELGKTLIVDDSATYLKLLTTLPRPYATSVLTARDAIDANPDLDVVVCDIVIGDEDGSDVLDHLATRPLPRPQIVMVTGHPEDDGPERAARQGAVGYLRKPTRLRELELALRCASRAEHRLKPRVRCAGVAMLVGPESGQGPHMAWDVYNLSIEGAFLETKGPLPVGEELELLLQLAGGKVRVRARVVRVQEPSWLNIAGVGVAFVEPSEEAEALIAAAIGGAPADGTQEP
jgi:CheY-like chemotaxis protein